MSSLYYGYGTITNVPFGTLAADFKTHLTPADGATFDVYKSNETTLETGKIIYGDEVIVTAQDGTTKGIYSIYVNANTASPIATITSDTYTVSNLSNTTNGTGQITDVSFGTSATIFKTHLTPATGATFEVYLTDGVTPETGNVVSNDEVIVTAANETTTGIYLISIAPCQTDPTKASYCDKICVNNQCVAPSTDASATSSSFTVGALSGGTHGTGTITGVPFQTFASDFKNNLTPAIGTTSNVYQSDGVTVEYSYVATGDKFIVTAQDGVTKGIYTISIVGRSDASVTSYMYSVSALSGPGGTSGTGTITNVYSGISVSSFVSTFYTYAGATFNVYQSNETTLETGNVITGDKLIVTAEDGATKGIYTISVISSDASVTSSVYNVSALSSGTSGTGTITGVPSGVSATDFLANLNYANGTMIYVYSQFGGLEYGNVVTGDYAYVTAADYSRSATYTITADSLTISLSTNLDCVDYTSVPLSSLATCGYLCDR